MFPGRDEHAVRRLDGNRVTVLTGRRRSPEVVAVIADEKPEIRSPVTYDRRSRKSTRLFP